MKIVGQLNRSFDRIVTLRGVAKLRDLAEISAIDEEYQRELIGQHKNTIVNFFDAKTYTFFPEIILSLTLNKFNATDGLFVNSEEKINLITDEVPNNILERPQQVNLKNVTLRSSFDTRFSNNNKKGTLELRGAYEKLHRIDGNHRLSSAEFVKDKDVLIPFCIIFLRHQSEANKFNRVLFNNINFKSIPLTQEQNLKLIFEEKEDGTFIFSDEELNDPVWFGPEYQQARNLYYKVSLENLSHVKNILKPPNDEGYFRTFLLEFVSLLIKSTTPERIVKNYPNKDLLNKLLKQFPELFTKIKIFEEEPEELQKKFTAIFPKAFIQQLEEASEQPFEKIFEETFMETFMEIFQETFQEYFKQELPESLKKSFEEEFPKKFEEYITKQWREIQQEGFKIKYVEFQRETFIEDWKRAQQIALKEDWKKIQQATFKEVLQKKLPEALRELEQCYKKYPDKNQNYQLLIVHAYYYFHGKLNQFHNWVLENHIYELAVIDPQGIINIFSKVFETKKRTIFLATSFDKVAEQNTVAIKSAIDDINNGLENKLNLTFIRIDETKKGYSFAITEEILKHLEQGGYMIADISLANPNVYYELGYQMGLNTGKGMPQNNFLLVHNKGVTGAEFDKDKNFNISHISIEKVENSNDLREKVKEQLKKYYRLDEK